MNNVLHAFVNATIGFSENLFIVDGSAVNYCQVVRFVCLSVFLSVCPGNFVTAITSYPLLLSSSSSGI